MANFVWSYIVLTTIINIASNVEIHALNSISSSTHGSELFILDSSKVVTDHIRGNIMDWPRGKRDISSSNLIITQHFIERLVSPGQDVSLQCTASGEKPPRFKWERDGVIISPNTDQRYTLGQMMLAAGIGVMSQLNITRIRVEDGGLYSCVAIEGESSISHMARLDVYGPPYIRNLPPVKVQNGEPMKLRCPYYGYPISKLEWEHKGKIIVSSMIPEQTRYKRNFKDRRLKRKKRQVYSASERGTLTVPTVVREDQPGSYICIVYSPTGEMARRSFEIQVVEAPELDELRMGSGLKEGQIVQITCNIIGGDPPIYFSWLKDGKKIPASLKIVERSSELFSVLIIKRVSLQHCGAYTCSAANHVGKHERTGHLYVNVAPKWSEEPTNTSAVVGARGALHCAADGYPSPQIHWMKRDEAVGIWRPVPDLAGGVMSFPNGTLLIQAVSPGDGGMYTCHASNGVGEPLSKHVWITVNKPVYFESSLTNLTSKVGFPVHLSCQPLGDQPVRIKWTLEGKPLDFTSARVQISERSSEGGIKSEIDITGAESRDGGAYECRASNPHGVASHHIYLTILEPPAPPTDVQIESVRSRSVALSWRQAPLSRTQYYTVQYTGDRHATWDHALHLNVTREEGSARQSVQLTDLAPASEYRVRVRAGNEADVSEYTRALHIATLQEPPSSAPVSVEAQPTESPGELVVSWSPPPLDSHHGPIHAYQVRVDVVTSQAEPEEMEGRVVKVSPRVGRQRASLSGLLKGVEYAVRVRAVNAAGAGPYSAPAHAHTREGAPEEAPSSVSCSALTSTALRVRWRPLPTRRAGPSLARYTILYTTQDGVWQNTTSLQTEVHLQTLSKFTNYTIKVAAYSTYGVGPFSYPITCTTLEDVPEAPSAVKALASSATSLVVSWRAPLRTNGVLTHYTVYTAPAHSTEEPHKHRVPVATGAAGRNALYERLELRELAVGAQLAVTVSANTAPGEGPPTATVLLNLTDRVSAGVVSLGGAVVAAASGSVRLRCECVGAPPPRALWYRDHHILAHHPRYTTARDNTLHIDNIDASLSGNYTCLARNLYGSDAVWYELRVRSAPAPPTVHATATADGIVLRWRQITDADVLVAERISYNVSWKEADGPWQDSWSTTTTTPEGINEHSISGLKCGAQYTARVVAANSVGESTPVYAHLATLGGVPLPPTGTEWLWSNASHIGAELAAWREDRCHVTGWRVEYARLGGGDWHVAANIMHDKPDWSHYPSVSPQSKYIIIGGLETAQWYQIRVTGYTSAGNVTSMYHYATATELGERIGPPSQYVYASLLVIACSIVLLLLCAAACVYILLRRHRNNRLIEYRDTLTAECKSESGNITVESCQSATASVKDCSRVYSAPLHVQDNKHDLYEISPYAQFALEFRTFGHADNQEPPAQVRPAPSSHRCLSETSFQLRPHFEDSDCSSRATTLRAAPTKTRRTPHRR